MLRKEKFRVDVLSVASDLFDAANSERSELNRLRSKDDSDCGICEQILILRGRAEGILSLVSALEKRGLL